MVWIGGVHGWENLVTLELEVLLERHLLLLWWWGLSHVVNWLNWLHVVSNHAHSSHTTHSTNLVILHVVANSVVRVTTVLLIAKSWLHVLVWTSSILTLTWLGSWTSHASLVHWSSLLSSEDGWETLEKQLKVVLDVLVISKSRPVGSLVVLSTESLEVVSILGCFVVDLSNFLDLIVVDSQGPSSKNKVVEFFLSS